MDKEKEREETEGSENTEEVFVLPEKPPENYISVLNLRNAAQEEEDKRNPPPEYDRLCGFCGTECNACEYYIGTKTARGSSGIGCRGCRSEGGDCDIRLCCLSKGIKDCGSCGVFPCDMLKKSSHEEDDENLFRMKEEHDKTQDSKERTLYSYIVGSTVGAVAGLLFAAISGLFPQLLICGIAVGLAVPLIINYDRK